MEALHDRDKRWGFIEWECLMRSHQTAEFAEQAFEALLGDPEQNISFRRDSNRREHRPEIPERGCSRRRKRQEQARRGAERRRSALLE